MTHRVFLARRYLRAKYVLANVLVNALPWSRSGNFPGPDPKTFFHTFIQTLSYAEGFSPLQMDSNGNITALQPILFPSDQFPALQHDARLVSDSLAPPCVTNAPLVLTFRRGFEESLLAKLDQSL